ncbi:MAG: ABC transporter permease [Hyphomonas sp.]|nr:ABC transporter permease [Hyphomonas sp.]
MADALPERSPSPLRSAVSDILADFRIAARQRAFWTYQAYQKVRLQYARSLIGPLWLTATMALQLVALTYLFSGLFGADMSVIAPWVTVGVIAWTFFSSSLNESSSILLVNKPYIMESETSLIGFVIGVLMKNLIVAAHHLVLLVILIVWFRLWPNAEWLWLLASLPVYVITTASLALILAILTPRFRDLGPLTENILMVGFFLTPVLWRPQSLVRNEFIATFNPLTHLLAIVRQPLLGHAPQTLSWVIALWACGLSLLTALLLLATLRRRIAFWI